MSKSPNRLALLALLGQATAICHIKDTECTPDLIQATVETAEQMKEGLLYLLTDDAKTNK